MRLIDADALVTIFSERERKYRKAHAYDRAWEADVAQLIVIASPTIEAQPVRHGEWLNSSINGTVSCSLCMFTDFFAKQNRVMLFKYCPNCGAKIDGGDNST